MNEVEIDQTYLDESFINLINNLENEKLAGIVNYILENFESSFDQEKLANFTKVITALCLDVDSNKFLRQLRYLINKGTYNRLFKKFKNDLLSINLSEEKIDLMIDIQRNYLEKINQINKKEKSKIGNSNYTILKDFEVKTEMPVFNTNYKIKNEKSMNNDIKKQNLILNLKLQDEVGPNNLILQMDKAQLINFYEEIEKIQEKLDKLY